MPAPPRCPSCRASNKASSSTTDPRPTLTRTAPRGNARSSFFPSRLAVAPVPGKQVMTACALESNVYNVCAFVRALANVNNTRTHSHSHKRPAVRQQVRQRETEREREQPKQGEGTSASGSSCTVYLNGCLCRAVDCRDSVLDVWLGATQCVDVHAHCIQHACNAGTDGTITQNNCAFPAKGGRGGESLTRTWA